DLRLRAARARLAGGPRAGAHRPDLTRNGVDEDTRAITLMDAWWPRLVAAEFQHAIGSTAYRDLFGILPPASVLPGDSPTAPDYDDGWWGYVSKDPRDMFSPGHVRGKFSHHYCARGSQRRCRAALRQSLLRALGRPATPLHG